MNSEDYDLRASSRWPGPLFLIPDRKNGRGPSRRCILFISLMLLVLAGCHSSRQVAKAPDGFYEEYARILKMPLTGAESPVLIREVSTWIGTPYVFGGITRKGADCSGFALSVYQKIYGLQLPRTTQGMAQLARKVSRRNLREGHLVFFRTEPRRISHVGIYLGQGYFVHASSSKGVIVSHLDEPYYARTFAHGGWVQQEL